MSSIAMTFGLPDETKTIATPLFDGPDSYFSGSRFDYSIPDLSLPFNSGFSFASEYVASSESSGSTSSAESLADSDDDIFDLASPSPSDDQFIESVVFNTNGLNPALAPIGVKSYSMRNAIEEHLHSYYDENGYYPKLGLFDDYQSETEDEDEDADGEIDDGDYVLTSYTPYSLLTAGHTSLSSPNELPGSTTSRASPSDDSASSCYSSSDDSSDEYEDQAYSPRPRRASSLPAAFFSATRADSSSAPLKRTSHSTASSPKRKFEALETDEDEEDDGVEKPYKTLRDSTGKLAYQCRKCPGFRTKASGDMRRHLESLIHRPPGYQCYEPGCDKLFTRKDALKRHVLGVHEDGDVGKTSKKHRR